MRLMDDTNGVLFFFSVLFDYLFRWDVFSAAGLLAGGDVTVTVLSIAAPHIFNVISLSLLPRILFL